MTIDMNEVYKEFSDELTKLSIPHNGFMGVKRLDYTKAMEKVQKKYGLRQGHPQFLEWVFTCVGRSPMIIEDEEGAGSDESTT